MWQHALFQKRDGFPMLVRTLESRKPLRDRLFVLILVATAIAMGARP
jgi:hypothetical protein